MILAVKQTSTKTKYPTLLLQCCFLFLYYQVSRELGYISKVYELSERVLNMQSM